MARNKMTIKQDTRQIIRQDETRYKTSDEIKKARCKRRWSQQNRQKKKRKDRKSRLQD